MRALIAVVALLTLAGCFGGGAKQLSQEEAERVAEDAMEAFAQDMADPDGGRLTTVEGTFQSGEGIGGDIRFFIEWGRERTGSVSLEISGGFGFDVEIVCGTDRTVFIYGTDRIEARPDPDASCIDSFQETDDPLELEGVGELEPGQVTPNKDGTVTAVFTDDDGNFTVTVDTKGRLSKMVIDTETGSGTIEMGYGARRVIQAPAADDRMPALIEGSGSHDGQRYTWTGTGDASEPYSEFEVRVVHASSNETVATFALPEDAEQGGFTFTFSDDGDGEFGGLDSFTIESEAWTSPGQYQIVIWDTWADRAVGDVPIPGFGPWAVLGLLGVALLRR